MNKHSGDRSSQPSVVEPLASCQRIMNLVDEYHEQPHRNTRYANRAALMDEWIPAIATPAPRAPGQETAAVQATDAEQVLKALKFYPSASHISPDLRDLFNATLQQHFDMYVRSRAALPAVREERMETVAVESKIKLAARLYEMRETAKQLLGADYPERMQEFGAVLSQTAARDKKDVLQVAVEVCKQPGCGPMETIMVMAPAVELVEPTPAGGGTP